VFVPLFSFSLHLKTNDIGVVAWGSLRYVGGIKTVMTFKRPGGWRTSENLQLLDHQVICAKTTKRIKLVLKRKPLSTADTLYRKGRVQSLKKQTKTKTLQYVPCNYSELPTLSTTRYVHFAKRFWPFVVVVIRYTLFAHMNSI